MGSDEIVREHRPTLAFGWVPKPAARGGRPPVLWVCWPWPTPPFLESETLWIFIFIFICLSLRLGHKTQQIMLLGPQSETTNKQTNKFLSQVNLCLGHMHGSLAPNRPPDGREQSTGGRPLGGRGLETRLACVCDHQPGGHGGGGFGAGDGLSRGGEAQGRAQVCGPQGREEG